MHIATSTAAHGGSTTTVIAVVTATAAVVGLGLRLWSAARHNRQLAEDLGGFTSVESSLVRVHTIAIVTLLVGCLALAVAAMFSTTVRNGLAKAGEHGRTLVTACIPAVLLYGGWLRRRVRRAAAARAAIAR
jgi:hypothetical protein